MQIGQNSVVMFEYVLKDSAGKILEHSPGPIAYLHGGGGLIPGLERQMEGKGAGDAFSVVVSPEEGYGMRDEGAVQVVPVVAFGGHKVEVGMRFKSQKGEVRVTKVEADKVTVDGNHELAGKTLGFDVKVTEVRAATAEELAHGHVHGPGGHHHH